MWNKEITVCLYYKNTFSEPSKWIYKKWKYLKICYLKWRRRNTWGEKYFSYPPLLWKVLEFLVCCAWTFSCPFSSVSLSLKHLPNMRKNNLLQAKPKIQFIWEFFFLAKRITKFSGYFVLNSDILTSLTLRVDDGKEFKIISYRFFDW